MSFSTEDLKEVVEQVTLYINMTQIAAEGLKQIYALLDRDKDLSQAELQDILIANRAKIEANEALVRATIKGTV